MSRILIVDDEESIRIAFQEALRSDGHETYIAKNVNDAVGVLGVQDIDVAVCDIIMPGPNGISFLSHVRDRTQDIQVVLVTGEPTIETAAEAVRHGAFDYLSKPVSCATLRRTVAKAAQVKSLLDEKRGLEEKNHLYQEHLEKLVQERTVELKTANDRLRDSVEQLRETVKNIIKAMSITIEKRDPYTAGHQLRVARLAKAIAEEMKLPADRIDGLYMASVVHDIGKINIPAEILVKTTKLCAEERSLIRKHPEVGYEILSPIEFPCPVAQIVLQHHERIDGSGYPQALAGEAILLEARILGVADVCEAMASHRPYRPALGIDAALEEISKHKGALYDPDVVEACVRLFKASGFNIDAQAN